MVMYFVALAKNKSTGIASSHPVRSPVSPLNDPPARTAQYAAMDISIKDIAS